MASSLTLTNLLDKYPSGTTIGAYKQSNWATYQFPPSGAPVGSSDATGSVSASGAVTLTGLTDDTDFFLVQPSGGTYTYTRASTRITHAQIPDASITTIDLAPSSRDVLERVFQVHDPRYGAVGDGVADDRPAWALAVADAHAAGGGIVTGLPGKTYLFDSVGPLAIPANRPGNGWLILSGYGQTIKMGANMPVASTGFLTASRSADYQTLARVIVEGFAIDGNRFATAASGLRGGNIFQASGATQAQRLNVSDLIFRDIYSYNLPSVTTYGAGTGTFNNQTHLYIAPYHLGQGETQTTIKRVYCKNVVTERGVAGIFVGGQVTAGTGCEVYYDDIVFEDCAHDYQETYTTATGSNFQVGSQGFGDRVRMTRCKGSYGNDSSFEVDAAQDLLYQDCTVNDPRSQGFYWRNFHSPQDAATQRIRVQGCKVNVTNVIPDNAGSAGYSCHGIQSGNATTDIFGDLIVRDYLYRCTTAMLYNGDAGNSSFTQQGHAISIQGSSAKNTVLENVHVEETNIALDTTVRGGTFSPVFIQPSNGAGKQSVRIDGLYVKQAGAITAVPNVWTYFGYKLGGYNGGSADIDFDVRNVKVDMGLPSNANYAWGIGALGEQSGSTMRGTLRTHRVLNGTATTGGSIGIRFNNQTNLTLDWARIEDCDFRGVTTNNQEVQFTGAGTSNAVNVIARDSLFRSGSTQNQTNTAIVLVSGTAYQNLDMVRQTVVLTGGTGTSDISISRDNTTFVTIAAADLGATRKEVVLDPGHALKATFATTAPTATKIQHR